MANEIHDVGDVPTAGTSATVLSLGNEHPYSATVASWIATAEGLAISARVIVTPNAARALAGHRVLVSVRGRPAGFTVFSGIARLSEDATLDISGIATVVSERRRQDLRASAEGRVSVSTNGYALHQLRALDLSRGGVKVSLDVPSDLRLGEHVTVDVDLGHGLPLAAHGEVSRVDEAAVHAVVRFDDLSAEDETLIDRFVLLQLLGRMAPGS